MSKYSEAYKVASKLTPKDFLLAKVRKANKLVKLACEKAEKYDELKTPKKPIYNNYVHFGSHYRCPSCNTVIPETITTFAQIRCGHCHKCGQELDWS